MSQRFRRQKRARHTIQPPAWFEAPEILPQMRDETDVIGNIDIFVKYLEIGAFEAEWDRAAARAQEELAKWGEAECSQMPITISRWRDVPMPDV